MCRFLKATNHLLRSHLEFLETSRKIEAKFYFIIHGVSTFQLIRLFNDEMEMDIKLDYKQNYSWN